MKISMVLAFLLGIASIAIFETILTFQASYCSQQQQTQSTGVPSHNDPSTTNKSEDRSHGQKQKSVSEPFACGVFGFPTAVRQFMNHNEGFVVGGFTFLLVFVTGWLVYVTGGLRESTEKLWLAGEKQIEVARIAATAADLSARAAIALELPVIRVVPDRFGYGSSQANDGTRIEYAAIARLVFSNAGRTQATPVEVRCGGFVGDALPDAPAYITTQSFPVGTFFGTAPYEMHLRDFEIILESGDTDRLINRQATLWFYCRIAYLDFMDNRHEQVFCWKRHELFGGGAFFPDATSAYNRKT